MIISAKRITAQTQINPKLCMIFGIYIAVFFINGKTEVRTYLKITYNKVTIKYFIKIE